MNDPSVSNGDMQTEVNKGCCDPEQKIVAFSTGSCLSGA